MRGEEFTKVYGNHNDPFTKIIPSKSYTIQVPAAHPIYENFRVKVCSNKFAADSEHLQLEKKLLSISLILSVMWITIG